MLKQHGSESKNTSLHYKGGFGRFVRVVKLRSVGRIGGYEFRKNQRGFLAMVLVDGLWISSAFRVLLRRPNGRSRRPSPFTFWRDLDQFLILVRHRRRGESVLLPSLRPKFTNFGLYTPDHSGIASACVLESDVVCAWSGNPLGNVDNCLPRLVPSC